MLPFLVYLIHYRKGGRTGKKLKDIHKLPKTAENGSNLWWPRCTLEKLIKRLMAVVLLVLLLGLMAILGEVDLLNIKTDTNKNETDVISIMSIFAQLLNKAS